MSDRPPDPENRNEASPAPGAATASGMPRWVKVFLIVVIVLVVLAVVALLTSRGGPGGHGPRRHLPSGLGGQTAPFTVT